ncbi:MAG: hypothetical protein LBR56_07380 [Sporomusaceae bacterium]|jgi:hypothetical protein|nr:hypothetical protein [Sporomusaceae bacterium]
MEKEKMTMIDAPEITLAENEKAGDALLNFYRAIGWNGEDYLDPCKIRTTKAVFNRLYNIIFAKFPNSVAVGMLMTNSGPGTDNYVPEGKVCLLEGWTTPAKSQMEGEIGDEIC